MLEPGSDAEVEGCACHVVGRDGLVGGVMEVVAVGDEHFRAFECLVEDSGLKGYGERRFELFELQLVAYLCRGRQVAEQSGALLLHEHTDAESLSEKVQRHVGEPDEGSRGVVDAYPLQARPDADAYIVVVADGGRVVVGRHLEILCELGVGLGARRQGAAKQQRRGQQKIEDMSVASAHSK